MQNMYWARGTSEFKQDDGFVLSNSRHVKSLTALHRHVKEEARVKLPCRVIDKNFDLEWKNKVK